MREEDIFITLCDTYPDIGLDKHIFLADLGESEWERRGEKKTKQLLSYNLEKHKMEVANQRSVFVNFAYEKGFDSLVAENWHTLYPVTLRDNKVSDI
jgi:hypothetical protein